MKPTDKVHKLNSRWKKYLLKICDLCEEKGIQVIFMELPTKMQWGMKQHNAFAEIAEERNIPFIDYNLIEDEIGLDWSTDTFDKGDHMNAYGATKVSLYMGQYLVDNYSMVNHKGDEKYATWDEDLIAYRNEYIK